MSTINPADLPALAAFARDVLALVGKTPPCLACLHPECMVLGDIAQLAIHHGIEVTK
jgi:hypothetical protein